MEVRHAIYLWGLASEQHIVICTADHSLLATSPLLSMMLKSHKHESLTTALYLGSSDSSKFHESSASQGFQAFISKNQQSNSLYASHSTKYIPSLTIKNAKSQKAQSVQSIQSQIHRVIVAVRTIYENPEDSSIDAGCSLESLYSTVEQIVLVAKHGEQLFDSVKLEMEKGVMRLSAQLRAGTSLQTDGEVAHKLSWLSLLSKAWIGWCDKTVSFVNASFPCV